MLASAATFVPAVRAYPFPKHCTKRNCAPAALKASATTHWACTLVPCTCGRSGAQSKASPLPAKATTKHVQDFLLSLQDRKLSERTIRNCAIVARGTLKFAFKQGYLASERLYDWKLPRMGRASVYMLGLAEVEAFICQALPKWA